MTVKLFLCNIGQLIQLKKERLALLFCYLPGVFVIIFKSFLLSESYCVRLKKLLIKSLKWRILKL